MDGNRYLDGIDIELSAPRSEYEILIDSSAPITIAIKRAFSAVIPSDFYLKSLRVRATSKNKIHKIEPHQQVPDSLRRQLIELLEAQKALMIAVSTGGPRINNVNDDYIDHQSRIRELLSEINVQDPNPFNDLWTWYGKWSDGSLPSYQSRREYIGDLFSPLISSLQLIKSSVIAPIEPTGWARVDRSIDKIIAILEKAKDEEDYQSVGLHCREALISLSQAIYDPEIHNSPDSIKISKTDSKRMLEAYILSELPGKSNEYLRKHVKAAVDLAVNLQHKRTATFKDAALCAEATRSIINIISIMSGRMTPTE